MFYKKTIRGCCVGSKRLLCRCVPSKNSQARDFENCWVSIEYLPRFPSNPLIIRVPFFLIFSVNNVFFPMEKQSNKMETMRKSVHSAMPALPK